MIDGWWMIDDLWFMIDYWLLIIDEFDDDRAPVGIYLIDMQQNSLLLFIFVPAPTVGGIGFAFFSCLSIHLSLDCVPVNIFAWLDSSSLTLCQDFNETCHKYSSCKWALLKRFSRSEVKGQGHEQTS